LFFLVAHGRGLRSEKGLQINHAYWVTLMFQTQGRINVKHLSGPLTRCSIRWGAGCNRPPRIGPAIIMFFTSYWNAGRGRHHGGLYSGLSLPGPLFLDVFYCLIDFLAGALQRAFLRAAR
jgi:hypothetical protein